MQTLKISNIHFYGNGAVLIKDAVKKSDKKIENLIKPADDFVNFNQSSYSVPTGENALEKIKAQQFKPDSEFVAKEYFKNYEIPKPTEDKVSYISESTIL